jgi:hypothetical protein
VKNEVLHRVKEERNVLHTKKEGRVTGLVVLQGNCLLKHVIEGKIDGKIEVTGRQGGRRKQLLDE